LSKADELIELKASLEIRIAGITSYDERIESMQKQVANSYAKLSDIAVQLSKSRNSVTSATQEEIITLLKLLGMPNAQFIIQIEPAGEFTPHGADNVTFLFSANRQIAPQDISKVASGGETSRFMLALKSVVSSKLILPTVIFDEIDTGVSGDIADKMGKIMRRMAQKMQVVSITHLPQVAAIGATHFLVFKEDNEHATYTRIKKLNNNERVIEIAKMLSGEKLTEAAISNATTLLNY
jgi:DNA repair protein RecN (Recombination protein N)